MDYRDVNDSAVGEEFAFEGERVRCEKTFYSLNWEKLYNLKFIDHLFDDYVNVCEDYVNYKDRIVKSPKIESKKPVKACDIVTWRNLKAEVVSVVLDKERRQAVLRFVDNPKLSFMKVLDTDID